MLINFTVLFSIVTGPLHFHCFLVSIDWLSGRLLDPIFSIFPIIVLELNVGYLITVHSISGYFKIWHNFYFHCTCISLPNIGNQFPWLLMISIGIWKSISVNSYMHSDQKCIFLIFLLPLTLISPAWLLFSTYSICSYSLRYTYQDEPFNIHSPPCIKQCTFSTVKPHFTAWRLYACRGERFEQNEYFPYSPRWPITWTRREIQQMAP